jgi:para-aminobenzoate synthetase
MRTLLIDNYDSYTHILAHSLALAGGELPIVIKNDALDLAALRGLPFDVIVISPGPGSPQRPEDVGICNDVLAQFPGVPLLGVCLGHQCIGHVAGAAIVHAPEVRHGKYSDLRLSPHPLWEGVEAGTRVVRYHSLVIEPSSLPPELEAIAWAEDDGAIMAVAHRERPFWGLQFHPESVGTEAGLQMLRNFYRLALDWLSGKTASSAARLHLRRLPWREPEQVFEALYAQEAYALWLDTAQPGARGRYSIQGAGSKRLERRAGRSFLIAEGGQESALPETPGRDWFRHLQLPPEAGQEELPFTGGWAGYLAYEARALAPPDFARRSPGYPEALMLWLDQFCLFDHERSALLLCERSSAEAPSPWLAAAEARVLALPEPLPPPPRPALPPQQMPEEAPLVSKQQYIADIQALKQHIRDGETYEACLTNAFALPYDGAPYALYRSLRRINPAPYAAWIQTPEIAVLSSSPECLFHLGREGRIVSEPIKGTRPLGETAEATEAQRQDLLMSEKDHSELLMITDLIRNDLAQICAPGSVVVREKLRVEAYATLLQAFSVIEGRLRPPFGATDALSALFPGGSITGAPKLRTLQLLDRYEQRPRGVYTGSVGYLSADGQAAFSVAIRTMVLRRQRGELHFGAGGAILAESSPEAEFEEMLVKAWPLWLAWQEAGGEG